MWPTGTEVVQPSTLPRHQGSGSSSLVLRYRSRYKPLLTQQDWSRRFSTKDRGQSQDLVSSFQEECVPTGFLPTVIFHSQECCSYVSGIKDTTMITGLSALLAKVKASPAGGPGMI